MTNGLENTCVWLIMPVLNELDNLRWLLPQMTALPYNVRVVVVDNGSTDGSAEFAKKAGADVCHCRRRGYGSAVATGMRWALQQAQLEDNYDRSIMVVFDADGSSPVEQIERTVLPIAKDGTDMVIAQRTQIDRGAMPPHAKFGNWLQVFLLRLATGFSYIDMGPLRALSFRAYERLAMEDPTWGWNIEMQMKAAMLKMDIKQFGIEYRARRHGKSKISGSLMGSIRAGSRILWSVLLYYPKAKRLLTSR